MSKTVTFVRSLLGHRYPHNVSYNTGATKENFLGTGVRSQYPEQNSGLLGNCHFSELSSEDYQRIVQQDSNNTVKTQQDIRDWEKDYLSCIFKLTIYVSVHGFF
jgi:hypothetical protein